MNLIGVKFLEINTLLEEISNFISWIALNNLLQLLDLRLFNVQQIFDFVDLVT